MVPKGMFDAPIIHRQCEGKVKFEVADGKVIESEGTQTLQCETKEGFVFKVQCHVAPVDRPIMSAGLLLKKGVATRLMSKNSAYRHLEKSSWALGQSDKHLFWL